MSRKCEICGKGVLSGNNVAHSNKKTKRQFKPNLQKVTAITNGSRKQLRICTKCLKSGKHLLH